MEYKILALDIATVTGWASNGFSGIWNLKPARDESAGFALLRLISKLKEAIDLTSANIIVFERPAGRHKSSIISQAEKHGTVKLFCEENNIPYRAYSAKEIKEFITNNGNAPKQAVIDAVNKKYNLSITNDNEADAIALYHLAVEDLKLG